MSDWKDHKNSSCISYKENNQNVDVTTLREEARILEAAFDGHENHFMLCYERHFHHDQEQNFAAKMSADAAEFDHVKKLIECHRFLKHAHAFRFYQFQGNPNVELFEFQLDTLEELAQRLRNLTKNDKTEITAIINATGAIEKILTQLRHVHQ
jgi:hypothetical protein